MIAYRTGLFSTPTSQGIGARAHRRKVVERQLRVTLDAFADRLAEHGNVNKAAAELGFSKSYGRVLLGKIKDRLGWQAQ